VPSIREDRLDPRVYEDDEEVGIHFLSEAAFEIINHTIDSHKQILILKKF